MGQELRSGKRFAILDNAPPAEAAYVVEWFWEVGPCGTTGTGLSPLSFVEIAAWAQLTGNDPAPWEVGLLRRLSAIYCNALAEISKPPD